MAAPWLRRKRAQRLAASRGDLSCVGSEAPLLTTMFRPRVTSRIICMGTQEPLLHPSQS